MSDKISAVNQVAAVATGNTVKAICIHFLRIRLAFGRNTEDNLLNTPNQPLQVFGSRLYQQLKDEPGNIIMSPFSVSGVMAMVAYFYLSLEYFWHCDT